MTEKMPDRATVQKAIDELIAARPKLAIAHHNRLRIIVAAARAWLTTQQTTDALDNIMGLAEALAAETNRPLPEAVEALRLALIGEHLPLKETNTDPNP
jgi:hypothetical protein